MDQGKPCPVMPADLPSVPPGIVGTTIEKDGQSVSIDYDPRAISDESVGRLAARLAPEAQRRFDKCVMRLGGRACEACALKLERKAQRIEGTPSEPKRDSRRWPSPRASRDIAWYTFFESKTTPRGSERSGTSQPAFNSFSVSRRPAT
jgi:hypothetical protein